MKNAQATRDPLQWLVSVALSGLMLGICFPNPGLSLLAWIAWVPVFRYLDKPGKAVFPIAWFASFIGFSMNLAWVRHTMIDYGGIVPPLAILFLGFLAAYCAVFQAMAVVCAFRVRDVLPAGWFLIPACFWVAFEYLRTHLFGGFPWNSLGLSQHDVLPILQNARWGSFYGVSFLIIMVNTAISMLICDGFRSRVKRQVLATIGITACALLFGWYVIATEPVSGRTMRIGLVQPDIAQDVKWEESHRDQTLATLLSLSESLRPYKPELIVWPESSITFLFRFAERYRDATGETYADLIRRLTNTLKTPLITGTLDQIGPATYNAAVLAPLSGLESYYYKEHLVPFGEYVPLPRLFFFVNRLVEDSIGTFDRGTSSEPLVFDSTRVGMMICYEGVFPELVRRRVSSGADLLCNITNDSWFGRSWAPEQHFSAYQFRAVENARPVIRSANTGISGAIDTRGRPTIKTGIFESDAIVAEVKLTGETTFYSLFGDVFALSCVIFCVIIATIYAVRRDAYNLSAGG